MKLKKFRVIGAEISVQNNCPIDRFCECVDLLAYTKKDASKLVKQYFMQRLFDDLQKNKCSVEFTEWVKQQNIKIEFVFIDL